MNAMERVTAALQCRSYDTVPVFPQVGDHAGRLLGYDITEMFDDAAKAAEAHLHALGLYQYDVVTIQVETSWPIVEACGGKVTYPKGKAPWITQHAIESPEGIDSMKTPDLQSSRRVANFLEGTRLLKEKAGVPVAAYVTGPMTMGFHLFGYEEAVKVISNDKAFLPNLTRKAASIILNFSHLMREAGADVLVICEHDAQMVSPMYIKKYSLPNLTDILKIFEYNILHMCGNVAKHLEVNAEGIKTSPGISAVSVGTEVCMPSLREKLGNTIGIIGNIDHINLLPTGSPSEIEAVCKKILDENKAAQGFMLAPGCEITVDTPQENIRAFVNAARTYGSADG